MDMRKGGAPGMARRLVCQPGCLLVTGTAVTASAAGSASFGTAGTVAVAAGSSLTAGTSLTLHVAFGLGLEGAHRQAVLAGLLVDLDELDGDLVALLEAAGGHVGQALPGNLGDVKQAVAAGHELHECAEVEDGAHLASVGLALLGHGHDGLDALQGALDAVLVLGGDLDGADAGVLVLGDGNDGLGLLLDALDDLALRADDGADHLLGNLDGDQTGHVGLVVLAGLGDGVVNLAEDVHPALAGLLEGFFQDFVAETVALDVHLRGGDAALGAGDLEVHVAEMVLVAEDVGKDGILDVACVGNEAHGDSGHRALHPDACVEQGQRAAADGGHRRRAVGLEDVADDAAGVGESVGEHALEGAVREVAVAHLAAADAALGTGLAGGEGREVIVEQEALLALVEHVVDYLLVVGGAEGDGDEGLCLAAGEDGGSVGAGQVVHLAPDGANLGGLAAVEADALVEHTAAHGLFLHVVVVALDHGGTLVLGVELCLLLGEFGQGLEVLVDNGSELLGAPVLVGVALAGDGVSLVVALVVHVLAQGVVVDLVAVFALVVVSGLVHELLLDLAVDLYGVVGHLEGLEQVGLGNLVHLALHHHDVVVGGADHEFDVGAVHLGEGGVDDPLAFHACHAHFGDGAVEGYVGAGEGGGGCQACEGVGGVVLVGRVEGDVDERLGVIVVGEEGTQHTVNEARGQDLVVRRTALALEEAAGVASYGGVFLFVFYGEGHEVHALVGLFGRAHGGQQHRVAHSYFYRSIGLLGQLARLDRDRTAVAKLDGFLDWL